LETANNGQDSEQHQRENRDPVRMWPALINLINSNARYWRAQEKKADDPEPRYIRIWTMVGAVAAWFGVILAGVAAIIFWRQLGEAQRQTKQSLETFRIDERAWVEIEPIKPILKEAATPKFGAFFTYNLYPKNVGKTAAYDIEVKAVRGAPMSALSLGESADGIDRYQKMMRTNAMEMPDALISRRTSKILGPAEISTASFDILGSEPQKWDSDPQKWTYEFLIGRVDYRDVFGIRHWMTFCFSIVDGAGNLQYCQYGNDVDRNPELPPN